MALPEKFHEKSGRMTITKNRFSSRCFVNFHFILHFHGNKGHFRQNMTNVKVVSSVLGPIEAIKMGGRKFFRHSS